MLLTNFILLVKSILLCCASHFTHTTNDPTAVSAGYSNSLNAHRFMRRPPHLQAPLPPRPRRHPPQVSEDVSVGISKMTIRSNEVSILYLAISSPQGPQAP